jgi:hypothetical protein
MVEQIVYVDRSEVRPGKLGELRAAVSELAAFVQANEPQLSSYGFFFSEDGRYLTVVAVHPDSASLEYHMDVAGPRFARFGELLMLERIDLYGSPSESVIERLRGKAELLGHRDSVFVHRLKAGFSRALLPSTAIEHARSGPFH